MDTINEITLAHANCKMPLTAPLRAIGAQEANPFPPTQTDTRLFGFDFWEGSGNWDYAKTLAYDKPKVAFGITRSGQGIFQQYDDKLFAANARKMVESCLPWINYHVLMPQQDPIAQIEHLYDLINSLGGICPTVFFQDVELVNSQTPKTISTRSKLAIDKTREIFGKISGWYSAPWFTNTYMERQDWMQDPNYPYFHAQYLWPDQQKERSGIGLMLPFDNWIPISQMMIHQTTSYGDAKLFGFTSTRLDFDRWMWSEEKYKEIFKLVEPEPEPPTGLEERVVKLEERVSDLERWAKGIAYG
jgi:hypothetical protein